MNFLRDLQYAYRTLRKSPGFWVLAVSTLALGIAANTAIFSLFYQVLLRSLPVQNADRLVVFHSTGFSTPGLSSSDNYETIFSYPMYRSFADRTKSLAGVAARTSAGVEIEVKGVADRVHSEIVTGNFFDVLGVHPALGRLLAASDDRVGAGNPVVVLAHDYWLKRFGGSAVVLNAPVTLNEKIFTVIGVAPKGFRGILSGESPDVFAPMSMLPFLNPQFKDYNRPDISSLTVLGVLAPGLKRQRAEAELQPIFASTVKDHLDALKVTSAHSRARYAAKRLELKPAARGLNELEQQWRRPLLVLAAMVSLLLLIGCANLANLLLARGVNRSRETSIRLALGAKPSRIVSMLLAESLLVSTGGAALGLFLTPWLTNGVLRLLPQDAAGGWLSADVSLPVLFFCTSLMVLAALVSGIAPAWQSARIDSVSVLGDRTAATTAAHLSPRVRQALIVGQIALSLVLLSTAALFGKSLINLMQMNPGFRASHVLSFWLDAGQRGYDGTRGLSLYRELEHRFAVLPGVESVSVSRFAPLSNSNGSTNITLEGYTPAEGEDMNAQTNAVDPGYFRTLGTPLLAGREFEERDQLGSGKVAIVNQAFVKRFSNGRNPLGLHMTPGAGTVKVDTEIVGVVPDQKLLDLRETVAPAYFVPFAQAEAGQPQADRAIFLIRSRARSREGDAALAVSVRSVVSHLDFGLPVFNLESMANRVADSVSTDRLLSALSSAFGLLALILTAIGLYGVISYVVARRTSEIGVRMALGATSGNVMALVLREVGALASIGIAIGLGGALIASRAIQSQLFGFAGFDALLLLGAIAILGTVALAAGAVPAMRASRIQPLAALRHE